MTRDHDPRHRHARNDRHARDDGGPGAHTLTCDATRELLSARADGESTASENVAADAHLAGCAGCARYASALARLDSRVRVRPAENVPDLVGAVTARARPARLGRGGWMRPALAWVAVVMLVQNLPALVLGDAAGTDAHMARHVGAFGVALAIGFAYAAWRPHRAFGLLPFTAALVATTAISLGASVLDSGRGLGETIHLSEFVGLALLWMIAGSPGWRDTGAGGWRHLRRAGRPGRSAGFDAQQ